MLLPSLLALLLAAGPAPSSTPTPTPTPHFEASGVPWFEGSYRQALLEAERTDRILFLYFRTQFSSWCDAMDRETFKDSAVIRELGKGLVCVSIDAESLDGRLLASGFGVSAYPTLLFIEPDGSPRDSIDGFVTAPHLRSEVLRIKRGEDTIAAFRTRVESNPSDLVAHICLAAKLRRFERTLEAQILMDRVRKQIQQGIGFEANSIESRWALAAKLREVGELDLYREQADAILRLDPESRSLASRSIAIYDSIEVLRTSGSDEPLRKCLKNEADPQLNYLGWRWVAALADEQAKDSERNGFPAEALAARTRARKARKSAWPHCPPTDRALFANNLAWAYFQDRAQLDAADRRFALQLATEAQRLEPANVLLLDTYACCLWMNARLGEAEVIAERCVELDPENKEWRKRLTQLRDSH